jgi:hypothetical protein
MTKDAALARYTPYAAWLVILLAAGIRLQGMNWDAGLLLHPDERNIATAATRLAFPDALVPQFHAYNGLSLYLPRLLAEIWSLWNGRSGADLAQIVLAGRLLSALYGILALPLLWSVARRMLGACGGLTALVIMALSPGLIQAAHFATTESGLVLCLTLLLWLTVRHIAGELSLLAYAVLAGFALGFGFGLKTSALVFAVLPLVAATQTTLLRGRIWPAFQAGMFSFAVLVVVALITTPQIWAAPQAYIDTMRFESGVVSGAADVFWTYQFSGARNGLFELSQLPWLAGPLAAPLGLAGLVIYLYRIARADRSAPGLAAAAVFMIVYALIICGWHAKFIRYLILLLPPLALFAGYFVTQVASIRLRVGIAGALVMTQAATGVAQAALYQVTDARISAWQWLAPKLEATERLVVEPVDLGPPYPEPPAPGTTTVLPLIAPSSPQKLQQMADTLAAGKWMIIASRRHYGVLPRLRDRFPEMCGYYDALWTGRLGYRIAAEFRRRPELPVWIDPEIQAEETFTVFDSPRAIVLANDAHLPPDRILAEILAAPSYCELILGR